jgi:hypothetical protein
MPSTANFGPSPATVLPVTQIVAGTVETMVLAATPASLASSPVNLEPSATAVLAMPVPPNAFIAGLRFSALWQGVITAGAALSATLKLYGSKATLSTTPGSNTLLGTSGAQAFGAAGSFDFWAEFQGIYSAATGKLTGVVIFLVNNVFVGSVAVSNVITGITATNTTGQPILNFGLSITFGTANATNSIFIPIDGASINF